MDYMANMTFGITPNSVERKQSKAELNLKRITDRFDQGIATPDETMTEIVKHNMNYKGGLHSLQPDEVEWAMDHNMISTHEANQYVNRKTSPISFWAGETFKRGIFNGLRENANQLLQTLQDVDEGLMQGSQNLGKELKLVTPAAAKLPKYAPDRYELLETEKPTTTTGQIISTTAQVLPEFLLLTKALRVAEGATFLESMQAGKLGSRFPTLARYLKWGLEGSAAGAITDFTAFDPKQPRLANILVEQFPSLSAIIPEYLMSDPSDSALEGRFKNSIEGFLMGLPLGMAAGGIFEALKVSKNALWDKNSFDALAVGKDIDEAMNLRINAQLNTQEFQQGLKDNFKKEAISTGFITDDAHLDAVTELLHSRAITWSIRNERPIEDYYAKIKIEQGMTPSESALHSYATRDEWAGRVTDFLTKKLGREITAEDLIDHLPMTQITDLGRALNSRTDLLETEVLRLPKRAKDGGLEYDKSGKIVYEELSFIKSNADYKLTADPNTLCPKRFTYAATIKSIEGKLDRPLSGDELWGLARLLEKNGSISPCFYCYVEGGRRKYNDFLTAMLSRHDTAMEYLDRVGGKVELEQFEKDISATEGLAKRYIDEWQVDKEIGRDHYKVDQKLFTDPKYREELISKDQRHQEFFDAALEYAGGSKANKEKPFTPYRGDMFLNLDDLAEVNSRAGLRFFSNTDFQVNHIVDLMQIISDLALLESKAHAFTKVPEFVEIFGDCGIKINMSVAGHTVDGKVIPDLSHGMNWEKARELATAVDPKTGKRINPNAGAMFMATDDVQLKWALDQDWIDMVIPFHASGISKEQYSVLGWKNFQGVQGEKWVKKPVDVSVGELLEAPAHRGNKGEKLFMLVDTKSHKVGNLLSRKAGTRVDLKNAADKEVRHSGTNVYWAKDTGDKVEIVSHAKVPALQKPHLAKQQLLHKNDKETYLRICKENNVTPVFAKTQIPVVDKETGAVLRNAKGKIITEPVTNHPNYMKLVRDMVAPEIEQQPVNMNFRFDRAKQVIDEWQASDGYKKLHMPDEKTLNEAAGLIKGSDPKWMHDKKMSRVNEVIGLEKPQEIVQTPNAKLEKNIENDTFSITTPEGASINGYFKNSDFPSDTSSPTRGEIFLSDVPVGKQRQGIGTSLHIDALRLLRASGAETVNMHGVSDAGRKQINRLIEEGYVSEPLRTSATGKAEYKILVDKAPDDLGKEVYAAKKRGVVLGQCEFLNDGSSLVKLFKGSDTTTLLHELGHVFRRDLNESELAVAEKWLKVKDGVWTRTHHEKFVDGFLMYLKNGSAPSKELKGLFEYFRGWITEVYTSLIRYKKLKVSPEVNEMFDGLFSRRDWELNVNEYAERKGLMDMPTAHAEHTKVVDDALTKGEKVHPNIVEAHVARGGAIPENRLSEYPNEVRRTVDSSDQVDSVKPDGTPKTFEEFDLDIEKKIGTANFRDLADHVMGVATGEGKGVPRWADSGEGWHNTKNIFRNINDAKTIRQTIKTISDKLGEKGYSGKIPKYQSFDEIEKDAELLGMSPKRLQKLATTVADLPATVHAARMYLQSYSEFVSKFILEAKTSGNHLKLAEAVEHVKMLSQISADVSGVGTGLGRALAQQRMLVKASVNPEWMKRWGSGVDQASLGSVEDMTLYLEVFEKAKTLETKAKVSRIGNNQNLELGAMLELARAALVSGAKTQLANLAASSLTTIFKGVTSELSVLATKGVPEALRYNAVAIPAMFHGMAEALRIPFSLIETFMDSGLKAGWESILSDPKVGNVYQSLIKNQSVVDPMRRTEQAGTRMTKTSALLQKYKMPKRAADITGDVITAPFRVIGAMDEFFKTMNYHAEYAFLAYDEAWKKGLKGDAAQAYVENVLKNTNADLANKALERARYNTLNGDMSETSQGLLKFMNSNPVGMGASLMFAPFLKTPFNILKVASDSTPLGVLKASFWSDFKKGGLIRAERIAQVTIGTSIMGAGWMMYNNGMLTGSTLPSEYQSKASARILENAIQFEDGGQFSTSRLAPIPTLLTMGADLARIVAMKDIPEDQRDSLIGAALLLATKPLTSLAAMQSLRDLSDMLVSGKFDPEKFVAKKAGMLVPFSGAIKEDWNYSIEEEHEIRNWFDGINQLFNTDALADKRHPLYGTKIKDDSKFMVSGLGMYRSGDQRDPVTDELWRVGVSPKALSDKISYKGESAKLDKRQHARLNDILAEMPLKKTLTDIISSDAYRNGMGKNDEMRNKTLSGIVSFFHSSAQKQLLSEEKAPMADIFAKHQEALEALNGYGQGHFAKNYLGKNPFVQAPYKQ